MSVPTMGCATANGASNGHGVGVGKKRGRPFPLPALFAALWTCPGKVTAHADDVRTASILLPRGRPENEDRYLFLTL